VGEEEDNAGNFGAVTNSGSRRDTGRRGVGDGVWTVDSSTGAVAFFVCASVWRFCFLPLMTSTTPECLANTPLDSSSSALEDRGPTFRTRIHVATLHPIFSIRCSTFYVDSTSLRSGYCQVMVAGDGRRLVGFARNIQAAILRLPDDNNFLILFLHSFEGCVVLATFLELVPVVTEWALGGFVSKSDYPAAVRDEVNPPIPCRIRRIECTYAFTGISRLRIYLHSSLCLFFTCLSTLGLVRSHQCTRAYTYFTFFYLLNIPLAIMFQLCRRLVLIIIIHVSRRWFEIQMKGGSASGWIVRTRSRL